MACFRARAIDIEPCDHWRHNFQDVLRTRISRDSRSKVLALTQNDPIWADVKDFFPVDSDNPVRGVNLIEFVGMSEGEGEGEVETALAFLIDALDIGSKSSGRRAYTVARGAHQVHHIWDMQKRTVGLLSNMKGESRPIAFVDDTAVPPENLADYIVEFRAALDRRIGHVWPC